MDYRIVSKYEAIDIIDKTAGETIIKYERDKDGDISNDKTVKSVCKKLIEDSHSILYNNDKYVPNMDLFFDNIIQKDASNPERYVKLMFKQSTD